MKLLKKILFPAILLITMLSVLYSASSFAYADNEIDKTALLSALQIAETMDETDYTPASYQNLHALYLTYAAAVDTMNDQNDIDYATAQLLEAVNALVPYVILTTEANLDGAAVQVTYDGATYTDSSYRIVSGTTVTVTAPEQQGYFFAGWMETVSKRIFCDDATYTFPLSVNTALRAIYFREDSCALVFGTEGGNVLAIIEKTPAEWAAVSDLAEFAPSVPYHYGYTNGRWNIQADALQELAAGEYVFVEPVYDAAAGDLPEISAPAQDTIRLELHYRYDAAAKVGSFIMNSSLPNGVVPESIGTLFYYKRASTFNPTEFYVNNNNKMLVSQFDSMTDDVYITNMKKLTSYYNWAVRGYATYYDNGTLKTVYSNQVNVINTADVHDYRTLPALEPTCTAVGHTAGEACFICGEVVTEQQTVPALGHNYTSTVTPPTCTENGYITYTCTRCGNVQTAAPELNPATGEYTHPELLATGHDYTFNEVTTPATLTAVGEADMVCTNCGAHTTEPYYIATGSCGDNVTYSFDHRNGTLTLSGTGTMTNYENAVDSPFCQMSNLQQLIVENGVTAIGDAAFYGCSALSSVTLANTVTTIGNRAFYNCTSLTTADLNQGLTTIDYYAFYGCGLTSISIPSSLQTIESYAFSRCNSVTAVVLPGTLNTVGSSAFSGCEALQSVIIDANIESMGNSVFANCTALTSAVLQSGVRILENSTFSGCTALTNVTLSDTLYIIGSEAFRGCTALTQISLPNGLSSIESSAFLGCDALGNVVLPASLTGIGNAAFADCTNLVTQLPSQLQTVGTEAFRNCTSLTSITVPTTLTAIGNGAFKGCTGITALTFPDTLTTIGSSAFFNCSALTSLQIPAATESIGTNAFTGCIGLLSITVDSANTVYNSRGGCNAIIETATDRLIIGCRNTVIPNGITRLENYAFSGNTALTAITLPSSLTAIGTHVFDGCTALASITVPDTVTTIGDYTFNGCTALTSVTLPDQLTTVGKNLFAGCCSLGSISLPTTVTKIDSFAFEGCSSFTAITLPDGITSLGASAFAGCTQLQSVNIPSGISTIPARAFLNCSSLTGVTIPGNIRTIGSYAFAGCSSITVMDLPNTVTTLNSYAFKDCTSMGHIYIRNLGCKIGQNAATIPAQAVIHSYLSSTAKTYADQYNRVFQTLS